MIFSVLSWSGQREREREAAGVMGERAEESMHVGKGCPQQYGVRVFLCRINERPFHAVLAPDIC